MNYSWKPSENSAYLPGRHAAVLAAGGQVVGSVGIVHPEVLQKYDITAPVSALELNIEPFCFDQNYKSLMHSI
jgi:phenylalanyl-tRNA synthetase beta chain